MSNPLQNWTEDSVKEANRSLQPTNEGVHLSAGWPMPVTGFHHNLP